MWVQFGMSVVSGLLVLLVPETPHFLLVRGKVRNSPNFFKFLMLANFNSRRPKLGMCWST